MNTEVEIQIMELTSIPVITHRLKEVGKEIDELILSLNLENQVATDDTVKFLKTKRTELNNLLTDYETQRKAIKSAVNEPYQEFENEYKNQIKDKIESSSKILADKINEFELKVKEQKRDNLIAYFDELKDMEQLDWLQFSQLNITVNLSVTEKKYKEQILEKVQSIVSDLELISSEKYDTEILVEYKKTLNASQSILLVKQRKEAEQKEIDRKKEEISRTRQAQLRTLSFTYSDLTKTYNWVNDSNVYISQSDIENLSQNDWEQRYSELKDKTYVEKKQVPLSAPAVEKVEPPKQEKKAEIFEASFSVKGTYEQLTALSEFLKSNNYEYKNL